MDIRDQKGNIILRIVGDMCYDTGGRWVYVKKGDQICNVSGQPVFTIRDNKVYDTNGNWVYNIYQPDTPGIPTSPQRGFACKYCGRALGIGQTDVCASCGPLIYPNIYRRPAAQRLRGVVLAVIIGFVVLAGMGFIVLSSVSRTATSIVTIHEIQQIVPELYVSAEAVEIIPHITQEEITPAERAPLTRDVTVPEKVLFQEYDITVTLRSIEFSNWSIDLNVLIENNSDTSVTLQTRNVSINGMMVTALLSSRVAAGYRSNDSISFLPDELQRSGIVDIGTIEITFVGVSESWETLFTTETITIETCIAGQVVQTIPETTRILYDEGGITISLLEIEESFMGGIDIVFLITNNSSRNIAVMTRHESVNMYMVTGSMYSTVLPGKAAISPLSFFGSSLEDNGISGIQDIEVISFEFNIFDEDDWMWSVNSDRIMIGLE